MEIDIFREVPTIEAGDVFLVADKIKSVNRKHPVIVIGKRYDTYLCLTISSGNEHSDGVVPVITKNTKGELTKSYVNPNKVRRLSESLLTERINFAYENYIINTLRAAVRVACSDSDDPCVKSDEETVDRYIRIFTEKYSDVKNYHDIDKSTDAVNAVTVTTHEEMTFIEKFNSSVTTTKTTSAVCRYSKLTDDEKRKFIETYEDSIYAATRIYNITEVAAKRRYNAFRKELSMT